MESEKGDGTNGRFRHDVPWHKKASDIAVQSARDSVTDDIPQWAAAIAYYGLLSAFPLLLAAIAIAAFFVDPHWAAAQATSLLSRFLPQGERLVHTTIQEVLEARGTTSVLSILFLLWTGSRVFGVLTKALNIAFDANETYGYAKRLLVEVVLTLSVGFVFLLALLSDTILNIIWRIIQFLPWQRSAAFAVTQFLLPAFLLFLAFFLIYRYVPRGKGHRESSMIGAGVATVLFLIARPVFFTYVQQFASYNLVYGSLAIVIALMVWAWLMAFITLFGGELASHIHAMAYQGRSAEETGRKHAERSQTARKAPPSRPSPP